MQKEMINQKQNIQEGRHITYYFTILFTILGTLFVHFVLSNKMDQLNVFSILLALTSGGLPIGVVGAYIDYKISEIRIKPRSK